MKKKTVVLIAVLVAFMIPAVWLNTLRGVWVGDVFFAARGNRGDVLSYSGLGGSAELERSSQVTEGLIRHRSREYGVRLEWDGERARIEFDDGEAVEGRWIGNELVDAEGLPLWFSQEMITIHVAGEPEPELSKYSLAVALCSMDRGKHAVFGSLWAVAIGAFFYVLGLLCTLFPEEMYFFGSRWRFYNAELSDAGRTAEVFGGYAAMVGGIVFMFLPIFIS